MGGNEKRARKRECSKELAVCADRSAVRRSCPCMMFRRCDQCISFPKLGNSRWICPNIPRKSRMSGFAKPAFRRSGDRYSNLSACAIAITKPKLVLQTTLCNVARRSPLISNLLRVRITSRRSSVSGSMRGL